ncbi:MAG TPA: response regulator [Aggregatilineales bacterium]|nr:response regulator [Aggregatilineales bacterium]
MAVNLIAREFEVWQEETGEAGLARLRDVTPSVVLLDLRLPGMSGTELLDVMLQDSDLRSIPVVVVTASLVDVNESNVALLPNVTQVLVKPVKIEELMQAVTHAMEQAPR